jgi:hypothetical protein
MKMDEILDEIEEYLDDRADAEGNGPADWRPNKAMRLLNALQEARKYARIQNS